MIRFYNIADVALGPLSNFPFLFNMLLPPTAIHRLHTVSDHQHHHYQKIRKKKERIHRRNIIVTLFVHQHKRVDANKKT